MQFEKADADPFGVDAFLKEVDKEVTKGESSGGGRGDRGAKRNYGLQEKEDARTKKRARVDKDEHDEDDDDEGGR